MEDMCKSIKGLTLKEVQNAIPATPVAKYTLPEVKPSYVPPTPSTPYVPPKAEKENQPPTDNNTDQETRQKFNQLVLRARQFEGEYKYADALACYVKAMHIRPGDVKLERKIGNLNRMVQWSPAPSTVTPPLINVKLEDKNVRTAPAFTTPPLLNTKVETKSSVPVQSPPTILPTIAPAATSRVYLPKFNTTASALSRNTNIPSKASVAEERKTEETKKQKAVPEKNQVTRTEKPKEVDNKSEEETEKAQTKRELQQQPNGYFQDAANNAYVLKSQDEESELSVTSALYNHLFDYQREGMKWLWGLFVAGKGGILGDDMGLGKTMQVVGFIGSMIRSGHISNAMVVMPVSVLEHWKSELEKWGEGIRVKIFHDNRDRDVCLKRVKKNGGVLLTTYGLIVSQTDMLCSLKWDYIVFDEGHKIKDPARQITQKARALRSVNKILLSGTPIQNNLKEMWALFDWTCDGRLLGNYRSFKIGYENPIVKGLDRNATREEKQIGETVSASLMALVRPHFLRRDKKTLFGNKSTENAAKVLSPSSAKQPSVKPSPPKRANVVNTRKNDLVVWLTLSEPQQKLYVDFLGSEEVRNALNQTQSHLAALTRLKQICTHPALLTHDPTQEATQKSVDYHCAHSAKMAFLMGLIPELRAAGHRLLIFSQYTTMLNIIQSCIEELNCKYVRIDGSISSTAERERRIKQFNTNKDIFCFLLTTGAGALGINLTSADRVVIFDPSWNTNDNQAVDRVYRVGQTRDVVIYRLILCGTIDEKMYRKQVYKAALQGMMKAGSQYRYFSKQDLSEMFTLDDVSSSATQRLLTELHAHNTRTYPYLDEHIKFLQDSLGIVGVNHHDLLFSENPEDLEHSEEGKEVAARAQSSLFVEPTGTRRRKPVTPKPKTPRRNKVIVLDDEDEYDDYEIGTGSRTDPIDVNEESDAAEGNAQENTDNGASEENADNDAGEGAVDVDGEIEEAADLLGPKNFRRIRRREVDSEDESTGQNEEQNEAQTEEQTQEQSEEQIEEQNEEQIQAQNKEQSEGQNQEQNEEIGAESREQITLATNEIVSETKALDTRSPSISETTSEGEIDLTADQSMEIEDEAEPTQTDEAVEISEEYAVAPTTEIELAETREASEISEISETAEASENVAETKETETNTTKPLTACAKHSAAMVPFVCFICPCFLSQADKELYSTYVIDAKTHYEKGEYQHALSLYKKALDICDSDLELHSTILSLEVECMDL